jgi:hypothetical protein
MKRLGHLFEQIVDRDNLRRALHRAMLGKQDRPEVRRFAQHQESRLPIMAAQLRASTFPVGRFQQFVIHDPKERIITAPCFAERVLHHAIMNVCEPYLDRWLIADTYACRTGKGRLAALHRAQEFAGRYAFFLKLDIRKYFDSVSHNILIAQLQRRFKDARLLDLLARIIQNFRGQLGCGLPIGSLTSQHFANGFLDGFDRFVKEQLRLRGYVRYMDDMALWSNSQAELADALDVGQVFLRDELDLKIKDFPFLNRTAHGMDFLGCRVFSNHMILNHRSRRRFRRRLKYLEKAFQAGTLSDEGLQRRATALVAFTRTPGVASWRFRQSVLQRLPVSGPGARPG